jgi:hypothetical protein
MSPVRLTIATIGAAVILFVWGALSWMVLPWHEATLKDLPNEPAIVGAMTENITEPGVYYFPAMPDKRALASMTKEQSEAAMAEWNRRHEAGPIGRISWHGSGEVAMSPMVFAKGFGLNLLTALCITAIVAVAAGRGAGFAGRLAIVLLAGVGAAISSYGSEWNYLYVPGDYALSMGVDIVAGWFLAGIIAAAAIKRRKPKAVG